MLNGQPGKIFRPESVSPFETRASKQWQFSRVLIVDPILGSRVALAEAVTQPGLLVETASTIEVARQRLRENDIALVLVDHELGGLQGLELLVALRSEFPGTRRVLLTAEEGIDFLRTAIESAALSFLVNKPWDAAALRSTILEVLDLSPELPGWRRHLVGSGPFLDKDRAAVGAGEADRQHDVLVRGLLAGLNACESEPELFELLHTELAAAFRVSRWLWVDEQCRTATRLAGDWPIELDLSLAGLSQEEQEALEQARRSVSVTRLDQIHSNPALVRPDATCVSLAIRDSGTRTATCLVWVDRDLASGFVNMMRDLQAGLQMAMRRIQGAEARAMSARRLAHRVSEELRTPVGALTHAIDRLRGEAERAGLDSEWVDRVTSESQRVVRAMQHVEDELRQESVLQVSTSS